MAEVVGALQACGVPPVEVALIVGIEDPWVTSSRSTTPDPVALRCELLGRLCRAAASPLMASVISRALEHADAELRARLARLAPIVATGPALFGEPEQHQAPEAAS